jgi:lipoprotein-releasing system ATP-binding protein
VIKASNIFKSYGETSILRSVSLEIEKGELVAIIGPSGAGKTTLLQILGTLDFADSGSLSIQEKAINSQWKDKVMSKFRNEHIGFVFQFHNLLPEFTALENIVISGMISGKSKKELNPMALELLETLGIANKANNKPDELSGGEKQRVAIARALINQPSILLADEPTGNLDSETARETNLLFQKLSKELGQTIVLVTHNEELANLCDRKLEMIDGQFVN